MLVAGMGGYGTEAHHLLALHSNGRISAWGGNGKGEATPPANLTDIISLAATTTLSIALDATGHVIPWGESSKVSSMPKITEKVVSIFGAKGLGAMLLVSGKVLTFGDPGVAKQVADSSLPLAGRVIGVASSGDFMAALRDDGALFAFGTSIGVVNGKEGLHPITEFRLALPDFPETNRFPLAAGTIPKLWVNNPTTDIWVSGFEKSPIRIRSELPSYVKSSKFLLMRTLDLAGLERIDHSESTTALKFGSSWRFERASGASNLPYCESQAEGCLQLAFTKNHAFGIKPLAVIAAQKLAATPAAPPTIPKASIPTVASASPAPSVSKSPTLPVPASNASRSDAGGSKSSDKFPPGQWVKLFTKAEDLPGHLRQTESGVTWDNGRLTTSKNASWRLPAEFLMRNGGIRFTATRDSKFELRVRDHGTHFYALKEAKTLVRALTEGGGIKHVNLASSQSARPSKDETVWEIAAIGNRVLARCDAELMGPSLDDSISEGQPAFANLVGTIRDIEVINLDGLPEAEALRLLGVDEKGNDLRALAAKQEQQMAEQAKVVDAMAAIPELKALHEQFVKLQAERVTAPFEAEVAKLNAGYVGGIDREIANEKKAGHLDGVIALEAEKKLIADKQPVPAEDDAATTEALKKLRGIYRAAYAKIEAARAENLKALTDPLDARLKQIEATLTQQDRIAHAKTVREYREGLGKEGSADTPVRPASTGGAAAKSDGADKSVRAPLKKFPPGDDRKAAEWALDLGGTLVIRNGRDNKAISNKEELPKSSFEVLTIRLKSESLGTKPSITFTDLSPLAGLRSIETFEANGLPVTDDNTQFLASLPNLRSLVIIATKQFTGSALSMLKDCEQLQSVNFGTSGLRKQGIEQLGQLSGLLNAAISTNELTDEDVAPLRNLKKLTKLHLGRNPISLETWRQFKGMPLTSLQYTPEPGKAKEWTKELASIFPAITQSMIVIQESAVPTVEDIEAQVSFPLLKELSLISSATDDRVLEAISRMSNLQNLEFNAGVTPGALPITDEGIAHLLNLKSLNRLMLRRSQNLTPAALTTLARLKSLKTLELAECPQLDDAAIAAFKKERPDVTVKR